CILQRMYLELSFLRAARNSSCCTLDCHPLRGAESARITKGIPCTASATSRPLTLRRQKGSAHRRKTNDARHEGECSPQSRRRGGCRRQPAEGARSLETPALRFDLAGCAPAVPRGGTSVL